MVIIETIQDPLERMSWYAGEVYKLKGSNKIKISEEQLLSIVRALEEDRTLISVFGDDIKSYGRETVCATNKLYLFSSIVVHYVFYKDYPDWIKDMGQPKHCLVLVAKKVNAIKSVAKKLRLPLEELVSV